MANSSRIRLSCIFGNTFLRIIFSIINGTVTTSVGCTSVKALAMMAGLGRRVRKNKWQPWQNPKRNSTAIPYMWAIGRMLNKLSPGRT